MNQEENNKEFYSDKRLIFECEQALLRKKYPQPSVEAEWNKFKQNTIPNPPIEQSGSKKTPRHKTRFFVFGLIAGIAATVLLLLVFRWSNLIIEDSPVSIFLAQEGIQEVTMNLEDNKEPLLLTEKSVLDKTPEGSFITGKKAVFFNAKGKTSKKRTITTPCGKEYSIVLSDGTEIILNADSKLTFPTLIKGEERVVELEGEAYFKVAKNKEMPFVVKTDKIETRVLGTEFNVKAYKGSNPHITLIEGEVIVNVPEINKEVKLQPGEDISYINNKVHIKNVDTEYYTHWRDGFFYFDNVPLIDVVTDLGRWYNLNIEIEKASLMSYRLHFIVDRNSGIDEVIENLNNFQYLHAQKRGNTMIIGKKNPKKRD